MLRDSFFVTVSILLHPFDHVYGFNVRAHMRVQRDKASQDPHEASTALNALYN